ncbi:MAG: hypothetical protein H7A49_04340 [Akkermansiaceae bacterium]|nr:hypothetical protein [Akkermansiaceae bacterium]
MKINHLLLLITFLPSLALADLPAEAAALRAKRDAKVAEIDRVYAAELEKLQKRLMQAGNLKAANEIETEIARVVPNPFKEDPEIGVWKWGSGGTLTIKDRGIAIHSKWNSPGKWKKNSKGEIDLESDTGIRFTISMESEDSGVVKGLDGKAATTIRRSK